MIHFDAIWKSNSGCFIGTMFPKRKFVAHTPVCAIKRGVTLEYPSTIMYSILALFENDAGIQKILLLFKKVAGYSEVKPNNQIKYSRNTTQCHVWIKILSTLYLGKVIITQDFNANLIFGSCSLYKVSLIINK